MPITERLRDQIYRQFSQDPGAVIAMLQELEKETFSGSASERILAAVIIRSRGNLDRFLDSLQLAQADWRDVLVQAGLGNEGWPSKLDEMLGEQRP